MPRSPSAFAASSFFLVLAPGTVAGLVPWALTGWQAGAYAGPGTAIAGWVLIAAGLPVLLESFLRFARHGGTPAPVYPTSRLVVTGFYRHVRNPMYVAVLALIAGQVLLFASLPLALYGVLIWLIFHLFVTRYEEPKLRRQFPEDYAAYVTGVPRWLPRFTPWNAP